MDLYSIKKGELSPFFIESCQAEHHQIKKIATLLIIQTNINQE
jgi:hypothetical protein